MAPEVELLQALHTGDVDIKRHRAWLDLFLLLAQSRIDTLRQILSDWRGQTVDMPLPFAALTQADELAGLCAEQPGESLGQLATLLAQALRRASAQPPTPDQRQAVWQATEELVRQLHQHAAGVKVITPPHILGALH